VGSPVALGELTVTVPDGSYDTLQSLIIDGLPPGATLTDGLNSFTAGPDGGQANVTDWNLSDLSITVPNTDDFTLTAVATAQDGQGDVASASANESVTVAPVAATFSATTSAGVVVTAASSSTPTYNDGSANAPAGTPQLPSLLAGYAVTPPWEVAGVNYAVGIPTGTALKDAATAPGADASTHIIYISTSGVTLNGYDFSTEGGWGIYIEPGVTNTVIENCNFIDSTFNFGLTSPVQAPAGTGNLTLLNNYFQGNLSQATDISAMVTYNGNGTFTARYNDFNSSVEDAIDFSDGTATTIVEFNVFQNLGLDTGAHADSVQYVGGTYVPIVDFNTFFKSTNTGANGDQGIQVGQQSGGVINDAVVNNNVVIAPLIGGDQTMSYLIAVAVTSGAVVDDNYIDFTGAYGPFYPPSGSNLTFSGNVNLTTGAQLASPSGTSSTDVSSVTASPVSGTEAPGSTIRLSLLMDETEFVTGTPTLTLNDGGTATYVSGSGSTTLLFSYTVASTDTAVSALAITGVTLPAGASINDANGNAANLAGAVATFTGLGISPGTSSGPDPTAVADTAVTPENQAVTIAVLANDTDTGGTLNPASVAVSTAAAHGTTAVNATTGAITYTPASGYYGTDTFQYTVADSTGVRSAPATVTVTVDAPPNAVADSAVTPENQPVTIAVLGNDTDPEGTINPASVAVSTAAAHGTTAVNATTGAITYTPAAGYYGTDTFQYTVANTLGVASAPAPVTVTVDAPPNAVADSAVTPENQAVTIAVLANDTESVGTINPASVVVSTAAAHGTTAVSATTGAITYTPASGYYGTDTFQYTVANSLGVASTPATVTVTVDAPPITVADDPATPENQAVTIAVLAGDTDTDGTINPASVAVSTAPAHGTTTVNTTTGAITYTPASGYYGTDTFQYTVADTLGVRSAPATVTVVVEAPPSAVADSAVTPENQPVTIAVLGNDTDPNGTINPASVAVSTAAAHGTTSINATTGAIIYTPASGYYGTDTFQYTVANTLGVASTPATVTVTVNQSVDNSGYADGASGAPAGTPQLPTILGGYTVRPPWEVAGVDYAVGIPAGTTLLNPATISMAGVSVNTATDTVTVTGNNVTLSGYDFSLANGYTVIVEGANDTIENSNFVVGSNQGSNGTVLDVTSAASNFSLIGNDVNGNNIAVTPEVGQTVSIASSGILTIQYNYFHNSGGDMVDLNRSTTPEVDLIQYNVFENIGVNTAHADTIQWYNTQIGAGSDIGFNTVYDNTNLQNGNGALVPLAEGPNATMTGLTVNNDTIIQTAADVNANFSTGFEADSGGVASDVVIHDLYIDPTGPLGYTGSPWFPTVYYSDTLANPTVMSNVIDMVTGASVPVPTASSPTAQGYYVSSSTSGVSPSLSDVYSVTASQASGILTLGNTLTITVNLDETFTVTGTPTLTLNDGGTATYTGGSGTNALTFAYTVAAGNTAVSALAVTTVNLPGGATVKDSVGNEANLAGAVATFAGLGVSPSTGGTTLTAGSAIPVSATSDIQFSGAVATFSDSNMTDSGLAATITWGDGGTSAGTITEVAGAVSVSGTHTYAAAGSDAIKVVLTDASGATATATTTATVTSAYKGSGDAVTATEGTAFTGAVATFTDAITTETASAFTATIAWGDGTTSAGVVTGGNGSFSVSGGASGHVYTGVASYVITTTVTDTTNNATLALVGSATSTDPNVFTVGTAPSISAPAGTSYSGTVATFTDSDTATPASSLAATIAWGDGTTSTGTVTDVNGAISVAGSHTYTMAGTDTVSVTLTDVNGTATATATATASVAASPSASLAQLPGLFSGYAVRPTWLVAGVDYVVGLPATTVLKNPAKISMAGVSVNATSHIINVTGKNVTLNGYDFSLGGGWRVNVTGANDVIENSNFKVGTRELAPITAGATSTNLSVLYNTIDGGGATGTPSAISALISDTGTGLTVEYNWLKNAPQQVVAFKSGTLIDEFNLIQNVGFGASSSEDDVQFSGGVSSGSVISFNTIYNPPHADEPTNVGDGLQIEAQARSTITNTEVENNTIISPGPSLTNSYLIAIQQATGTNVVNGVNVESNFLDSTGADGAFYPTTNAANVAFVNNVNLKTGSVVAAIPGSASSNVSAVAVTSGGGTATVGSTVTIAVSLNEVVTVSGVPTLSLNDGGTATYTGGSGTKTLTFSNTVNTSNLAVPALAVTQVNLPTGAAIVDAAGDNANLSGVTRTITGAPAVAPGSLQTASSAEFSTTSAALIAPVTASGGTSTTDLSGMISASVTGVSTNSLGFIAATNGSSGSGQIAPAAPTQNWLGAVMKDPGAGLTSAASFLTGFLPSVTPPPYQGSPGEVIPALGPAGTALPLFQTSSAAMTQDNATHL
jgi:hypothetical protein